MSTQTIVLGGGCFWCLEAAYGTLRGVASVVSGYAGGSVPSPTYEQVSSGETGHAEVVRVEYAPEQISLEDILHVFFTIHDPTTLNRQGNDVGTQYRSVVLYANEEQKQLTEQVRGEVVRDAWYPGTVVTELAPLETFYPAEEYHQHYYDQHPEQAYCQVVIAPKLAKLREKYREKLA